MTVIAIISLLFLCFLSYGDFRQSFAISVKQKYQMDLQKRLQILNKPPVKTIITKETGDVFDCIPIYEQPAFDHPALNNHKIQLHPNFLPISRKSSSKIRKTSVKFRGTREVCPDGTVPIKRTTKEDLIRSDKELLAEKDQEAPSKKAILKLENKGKLFGSLLDMALYNLSIGFDQKSSAEVRFEAGPLGKADVLSVGMKVAPSINGDGFTRLFGYWHDGINDKGCYNTFCPGFIQVDKEISINYLFPPPLSVFGDPEQQYTAFIHIDGDPTTGNWWLYGGDDSVTIGYWPKELFTNLVNGSDSITWGGTASPGSNGDYPPMGNGYLPDGFYKDTCYFAGVRYVNSAHGRIVLNQSYTVASIESPGCYDLQIVKPDQDSEGFQIPDFSFMFGGPGGKCT